MRVTPVVVCLATISPGNMAAGTALGPNDLVEMGVERVYPMGRSNVVLLRSTTKPRRYLPIWIGTHEALAISLRLAGRKPPRPLTHDLLERVLRRLGAKVIRIQIEGLRNHIFIGRLFLRQAGRSQSIDARPSDCIALALGAGAPIYAARGVLAKAGMRLRDFLRRPPPGPGDSL